MVKSQECLPSRGRCSWTPCGKELCDAGSAGHYGGCLNSISVGSIQIVQVFGPILHRGAGLGVWLMFLVLVDMLGAAALQHVLGHAIAESHTRGRVM